MSEGWVLLGIGHETCVIVTFGSAVARTPARSVICGAGVGRGVAARSPSGDGTLAPQCQDRRCGGMRIS